MLTQIGSSLSAKVVADSRSLGRGPLASYGRGDLGSGAVGNAGGVRQQVADW